jgi:hypothetical protein
VALVERLSPSSTTAGRSSRFEAAGPDPEPVSAQAERLLYYALVGAIEAGRVRPRT